MDTNNPQQIFSLREKLKNNKQLHNDIEIPDSVKCGISPYFRVKLGKTGCCLSIVYNKTVYETVLFRDGVMTFDLIFGCDNVSSLNTPHDVMQYLNWLYAHIVNLISSSTKNKLTKN